MFEVMSALYRPNLHIHIGATTMETIMPKKPYNWNQIVELLRRMYLWLYIAAKCRKDTVWKSFTIHPLKCT